MRERTGSILLLSGALLCLVSALTVLGPSAADATPHRQSVRPLTSSDPVVAGQVFDGTPLTTTTDPSAIVIPDDLAPVAGAVVQIPSLDLTASSGSNGAFSLTLPSSSSTTSVTLTVDVTATGFGSWSETGIVPPSSGAINLFVEMLPQSQNVTAPVTPVDQPNNGGATPDDLTPCGHNSSGWFSTTQEPPTIRVWMTELQQVYTYNFTLRAACASQ